MAAGAVLNVPRHSHDQPLEEPRQGAVAVLGPRGFVQVAYADWGPLDAERVVLCVHGLTRNGRDFDVLAKALAEKGMRVVAPDLPGRGRSAWLANATDYGTPIYLAAMAAVIARVGADQVDWIGTSLGGFVGMHMAVQPGMPIRRLVLNDFGARVPGAALRRIGQGASANPHFTNIDEVEHHLRLTLASFGNLTPAQWKHLAEQGAMISSDGWLRLAHDPAITIPFTWPFMTDIVLWDVWDRIGCPVLLLRGANSDFLTYETMRQMQFRGRATKDGLVRAIEFDSCGHAPSLMVDTHIAAIFEFLTGPDAQGTS